MVESRSESFLAVANLIGCLEIQQQGGQRLKATALAEFIKRPQAGSNRR